MRGRRSSGSDGVGSGLYTSGDRDPHGWVAARRSQWNGVGIGSHHGRGDRRRTADPRYPSRARADICANAVTALTSGRGLPLAEALADHAGRACFPRVGGPPASAAPGTSGYQSGSVRGPSLAWHFGRPHRRGAVSELRPAAQSSVSGPANKTEAGCFPSLSAARCRSQAARAPSSRSTESSPSAAAARA